MNENILTTIPKNPWEQYDYLETNITVKMISDVIYNGQRVTTMLWRVPRFLLPQLNTYRAFSRNVSSCLTGDNTLYFDLPAAVKRGQKRLFEQSIEELYHKWIYGDALGKNHQNIITNMNLRTLNKDGSFGHTHIKDIRYEGEKDVYKVTLKNGKTITLTSDHRIMTEEGWKTLEDFGLTLHSNLKCSWFKDSPKISTNGQEVNYELLSLETLNGTTSFNLAEKLGVDKKELEKAALDLGVSLYKRKKSKGEIAAYRFKHVLEYHINKRHNAPIIASIYGTDVDKIKKTVKKFGLKFNFINRDNFTPWNKGKTYQHTEYNKKMFRELAAERAKNKGPISLREGYNTEKSKITTWLNSKRFDIYKKFNFSCYLCTNNQKLELHHVKPVALYPDLACDENNICLLCRNCHKDIHRNFLEKEFEQFYLQESDELNFVKQSDWFYSRGKSNILLQKFSKIDTIEYQGIQKVYDIEVEAENESFVCNGIVVHNSRAKRFSQTSEEVWAKPYIPYIWQKDHKGMQGNEQIEEWKIPFVDAIWKLSSLTQVMFATWLDRFGVSKQYTNRMIEPYMYVDYLVTSTDFEHFLLQRDSYHAQLEIQVLARRVKKALALSTPKVVKQYEWVLPFVSEYELEKYTLLECIKFSVARCARVSYQTKLGGFDPNNDYKLANRLATDGHFSPFEHQIYTNEGKGGNLKGITQLRKILEEVLTEEAGLYSEVKLQEKIYVQYSFNPLTNCIGSCLRNNGCG